MPASLEIEKHLQNPPETSVVIEIDPKTAEEILSNRNLGNRPPKPNKVQQFASDMAKSRWSLTGDTIKFEPMVFSQMAKIDCAQVSEVENPSKRMSSSELILRY